MGPTLVDFLFFCSFGWGPQIIFIIVFSFPFLLDVLNCAVLYQPTRLCNEAYIPSMAFYKKEELFQIIVEDSWIECISPFPAILINNLEENMESSGNGFFVYFVVFFFYFEETMRHGDASQVDFHWLCFRWFGYNLNF